MTHDCTEELHQVSLKATPIRLAVLEFLEKNKKPIDILTIISHLMRNKIKADPATIFRIINSFTDKGITKEIQFNEGKFRYELSSKTDHHHFICQQCGAIENISDCNIVELEKDIQKKKKFKIVNHSLEFFGICQNCQK